MDPEQLIQLVHLLKTLGAAERATLLTEASIGFDAHVGCASSGRPTTGWWRSSRWAHHVQPYGLVHGGICALAGRCSSACAARAEGHHAVGVENHPLPAGCTRGRRLDGHGPQRRRRAAPPWQATVRDAEGTCCAESTVVVRALPPGKRVAGQQVALRTRLPPVE